MELDELKIAWQTLDRRLEQQNAMSLHVFRERKLDKARSGLRPLAFGQVIQMAAGVLMSGLFAPFWIKHMQTPHLLVYGLLLHAYGLLLIISAARDLYMIGRIDYAAPVLSIQKQVAELRAWHLRIGPIFAITGCFIWIPLVLVVFYWLGADVWVRQPQVVYWFIASSFVALAVTYAILRWSRQAAASNFARSIQDSAAGRSVARAQAVLAEITQFENL